jgi:hypothetical protein
VWYSFTAAPAGGLYDFDTQGSTQPDTVLALYDACGGQLLARNNDFEPDIQGPGRLVRNQRGRGRVQAEYQPDGLGRRRLLRKV